MSEVNHGPLPGGGFWAGFCSNPECDVLGCPGDCRPGDAQQIDSCSTCGADVGEPCRDGCAYAARIHRGWRELPAPTALTERVLEEITEMRRDIPDDT